MSSAAWASFLDSLESELQAVARVPHESPRRAPGFVPPDLGPLPADLAARARDVLAAIGRAEDVVRTEMRRTSDQLHEHRQMDPRAPRPGSSFDAKA